MGIDVTMDMGTGRLRCNDCEKLRAEVCDLSAQLAAQREETATACAEVRSLRAEVERLKRERDELQSQFDRMSGIADEFRHQRDRAYEESIALGTALEDARRAAMDEAAALCRDMDDAAAIRAAAKEEK